jgi:hypothetical protein
MISTLTYPIPSPDVVGKILENEAVLVLTTRGTVDVLNEAGGRIWVLADGSRSIQDIADRLHQEFKVSIGQALSDTIDFISRLAILGVFTLADEPREQSK